MPFPQFENQNAVAEAIGLLANYLPVAEARVGAAAKAWTPERAREFQALSHALQVLREEHRRTADALSAADCLVSAD